MDLHFVEAADLSAQPAVAYRWRTKISNETAAIGLQAAGRQQELRY